MSKKKRSRALCLLIITISFLLFRLLILFSDIKLSNMYEERPMGFLAYNLINNKIEFPFFFYRYAENHGGHLISAILAVPFFYIFGTSLISLKLLPLCFFSLGTLILWFLFLDTYFSRKAAVCFSCLYILSPPYFTFNNMISWASHIEVNLFTIGTIFLFYKILLRDDFKEKKTRTRLYVIITFFGIFSGFGMFYAYTFLITLISCFIIWYVSDKNSFPKFGYVAFFAGIIVGFSPMILYLLSAEHYNLFLYSKPYIPAHTFLFLLKKFIRLLILGIPESFQFRGILLRKDISIFSAIYHAITLLAFLVLVYKNREFIKKFLLAFLPFKKFKIKPSSVSKEIILIIFIIVFLLIFTISQFGAPNFVRGTNQGYKTLNYYRYLLPLFPFLFAVISVSMDNLFFRDRKKLQTYVEISVIGFLCFIGLSNNLALVSLDKNFASGLIHKGFWVQPYAQRFILFNKDFNKIALVLNKFEKEDKLYASELFGNKTALTINDNISKLNEIADRLEVSCRENFYYGAFKYLAGSFISKRGNNSEEIIGLINKVPEKYKPVCYEALGYMIRVKSEPTNHKLLNDYLGKIHEEFKPYCFIGFGRSLVDLSSFYFQIDAVKIGYTEGIANEYKKYCYEGIGKAIGSSLNAVRLNLFQLEDIDSRLKKFYFRELDDYMDKSFYWMASLDEKYKDYAYKGFGEAIGEVFESRTIAEYLMNKIPGESEGSYIEGLKGKNILIQNKEKRILVIAPHPDDETLGCAGVIADAVKKGYAVKIVVVTNGDVYPYPERRVSYSRDGASRVIYDVDSDGYVNYIDYGYIRQNETIKAMEILGLDSKDIFFLGYPDGSLLRLYNYEYNKVYFEIKKPFKISPVLNSGKTSVSPYRNSYHSLVHPDEQTLYSREYVINDLKEIFEAFRPTDIFVTSEFDTHPDHQAVPLFVKNALKDLKNSNKEFAFQTKIHGYLIHFKGRDNYPDAENQKFGIWDDKNCSQIKWEATDIGYAPNGFVVLDFESKRLKHEAIDCYLSQNPQKKDNGKTSCQKKIKYSWLHQFVKDREEWWDLPTDFDFSLPVLSIEKFGKRDRIIFYIRNYLRTLMRSFS